MASAVLNPTQVETDFLSQYLLQLAQLGNARVYVSTHTKELVVELRVGIGVAVENNIPVSSFDNVAMKNYPLSEDEAILAGPGLRKIIRQHKPCRIIVPPKMRGADFHRGKISLVISSMIAEKELYIGEVVVV